MVLTNGWRHESREKAAVRFGYDYNPVEERHQHIATAFDCGALGLDDYLAQTVFTQHRSFAKADFIRFIEA